jgi:CubicO group peptidase (beta-lactamase class C family)
MFRIIVMACCVFGSIAAPATGQDGGAASGEEAAGLLDGVFAQWDKPDSPGMSVAVIYDGRILYERGFGMANLEHGVPNGPDTIFRIGSTSKQFTAACIAMLALRGDLDLDADVRTIIPELPAWETPVAIRNLVRHTSGIPDYVGLMVAAGHELDDHVTPKDTLEVLAGADELEFTPGSRFSYSNTNYFLLSQVVERVSGQSLRLFAHEHIFEPLDMDRTHYHDRYNEVVAGRADGYVPEAGGGRWSVSNTTWEHVGDGGVFTTVRDMAKWDAIFYDNPLEGGPELIEMITSLEPLTDGSASPYAFGLVLGKELGQPSVSHSGGWVGFRADMVRLPERKITVVVLSNCATANPSQLARSVLRMLL